MRVMFICAAGIVSGKEKQTLDFMTFLRSRGHDVFCATSSWGDGEFSKILTANNIPHQRIRLGYIATGLRWSDIKMTLHQLMYVPSLWWNYRRILSSVKPDIIVQSNFHHILLLLPVLGKPKHVFHVHEVFPNKSAYRRLFNLFNKSLGAFLGVSRFVCNSIVNLGVPADKVILTYNGVHPPGNATRSNNAVPAIAIVGQVGDWKGHDIFINALQLLNDIPWKAYIIGSGETAYVNSLKDKISNARMNDRIVFTGWRSGLENIYRDIDIVCVPSLFNEPFGLAAIEPGFFEIPVVVTDRGGLPEIVVDGQTGVVVPAGDAPALAAALRELLTNTDKRKQLGQQANQHVKKSFSMEASGSQFENTLQKLIGSIKNN